MYFRCPHCKEPIEMPPVRSKLIDIKEDMAAKKGLGKHHTKIEELIRSTLIKAFARTVAHELSQPLTAIISYAEGALRRYRSQESIPLPLLDVLERVGMLAREAAEIVPDLRDSIGKWESDTQNVDLNEVVRNAVSVISEAGNGEKIAIEMSLALEPQLLKGNFIQLQQIVLNLLQNGLESIHGVDGEGLVTIRTFTNNDQEIELTVSDNGTGLQPEVATRMFDALITTKQNRLGMGLPIALTIIEAYRGRLWVDPNPEGGTTFHVTFPTGNRG